jgi:GT2 family glycosyltransferase
MYTIVIPTYWTSTHLRKENIKADAVYDHPTPLQSQGTLSRLLESLKYSDLPVNSTTIVVIAATTHRTLEKNAERKLKTILDRKWNFDIKCFSASSLKKLFSTRTNLANLLNLYGYSNIRNLGLATAQILRSDIVVFLDDDVIVKDHDHFEKVTRHLGKQHQGKLLGGVAGFYTDEAGSVFLPIKPEHLWQVFWPKERRMNEAFKIIGTKRRLVETPFAFGGNMALHWKMFERVPFDPYITRGEDMDLLLNAKMFGFEFLLNTGLKVVHLPGEEKANWSEMRQDLYRFLYMKEKMRSQRYFRNVERVPLDAFQPYPGYFLGSGMLSRFSLASSLSFLQALAAGESGDAKQLLHNFAHIPKALHSARAHALDYVAFQRRWLSIMPGIRDDKDLKSALGY